MASHAFGAACFERRVLAKTLLMCFGKCSRKYDFAFKSTILVYGLSTFEKNVRPL